MAAKSKQQAKKPTPVKKSRHWLGRRPLLLVAALVLVTLAAYWVGRMDANSSVAINPPATPTPVATPEPVGGRLVDAGTPQTLSLTQISADVRWRYGAAAPTPHYTVVYRVIRYTSQDVSGNKITEYARVYIPQNTGQTPAVLDFAPGTTGVGDQCASSLEQPTIKNLGDYNAHYLAYASQGVIVVATDYEGMRDPTRLHHYMIGDLEGRAMLDAARAARQLPGLKAPVSAPIFLGGYSQGGQAAFWADQIDESYAPDVKLAGLVNFAPVSSVLQTWQGITHGADLNWFGPYVLASYSDYYGNNLDVSQILLPKWQANLLADVTGHCIDSAPKFWGNNPNAVYTPQFLSALSSGNLAAAGYGTLTDELAANDVTQATRTPKLLVQGLADTTILPAQTTGMETKLCSLGGSRVHLATFAKSTHYSVMVDGFTTALAWLNQVHNGSLPPTDCR